MSSDIDSMWPELDMIFARVSELDEADVKAAVAKELDGCSDGYLYDLYKLTHDWGATFVGRGKSDLEKRKRRILTSHIWQRGKDIPRSRK